MHSKLQTFLILADLSLINLYALISHLEGKLVEKTPTYLVVECSGVGYEVNISLNTFEKIAESERIKVLTCLIIKEDAHILYGFADEEERTLFKQLISVSGVGTNTARLMLSSLKPMDIKQAISAGNWALIKTVKGIGEKTAQKVVIDLKNKMKKVESSEGFSFATEKNTKMEEALSALVMLGFSKAEAEKGLTKIKQQNPEYTVEQLVKNTLKIL